MFEINTDRRAYDAYRTAHQERGAALKAGLRWLFRR